MLQANFQKHLIESGCDEAGRGCLAGPVYAAAVILPPDYKNKLLNDSKKLSPAVRQSLRPEIEREAISFAVAWASPEEIDKINILNASFQAMHRAIGKLKLTPELLLIDGNRFRKYATIDHRCIIGGDGLFMSIAAASILAKTYRDDYMNSLHNDFPEYSWNRNKGYGTLQHRRAIIKYGLSPFHRKTFSIATFQLELEFEK